MKANRNDFIIAGVLVAAVAAFAALDQGIGIQTINAPAQESVTCTDSDGSDLSVKGYVVSTLNGQETTYTDECAGSGILKEYTCNGNRIANRLNKCSCTDGTCA